MRREDLRGTCWQPCKADGSGFETEGCGELTCDGKTADHGNLRRKDTEMVGARREGMARAAASGGYFGG